MAELVIIKIHDVMNHSAGHVWLAFASESTDFEGSLRL